MKLSEINEQKESLLNILRQHFEDVEYTHSTSLPNGKVSLSFTVKELLDIPIRKEQYHERS